jgi:hypothetical protein
LSTGGVERVRRMTVGQRGGAEDCLWAEKEKHNLFFVSFSFSFYSHSKTPCFENL